jgi:hypothetical protein
MMRCNARIKLGATSETYCQKANGHDGAHSIDAQQQDVRCPATNPDGYERCSQPAGHFGAHHVAIGAVNKSW